ncbi:hypothetical protein J2X73_002539 [Novosphingobium sp. 1748]|uniref:hypothetical protein n=1 Tax=Novosphingobium sp. 1748 TaxID=2817760 RepID=UPI002857D0FE|nr:hypothetical protein [Novosphingobium sp. 1748]MDR6708168.1 hypothetical protein [Novosphingobium sp. 1748]
MINGRLTMRAPVERNAATGKDAWGNPVAADFQSIGTVALFAWSGGSREVKDGAKNAEIEDLRALFALGADIQPGDEMVNITDRTGIELIPGRLRIIGPVQRKHTHLEAALRKVK